MSKKQLIKNPWQMVTENDDWRNTPWREEEKSADHKRQEHFTISKYICIDF